MTCSNQVSKAKGFWIAFLFIFVLIIVQHSEVIQLSFSNVIYGTEYISYVDKSEQNSTYLFERTTLHLPAGLNTTSKANGYLENATTHGILDISTTNAQLLTKVTRSWNNKITNFERLNTTIGILIPTTTRKIKKPILEKLSLTKICLPSIYNTLQTDYAYTIYLGIDRGDYLETVENKLKKIFDRVQVVITTSASFTKTVNALARKAYQDGMEYLVRINDDTTFETKNWTLAGLNVLRNYTPPNIGVVGPTCHEGNTAILTHDMVHRTHLEIFDFYYPPYFDNWWADDWITKVYAPERSTKLKSWVVKHHLNAHGTRYHVNFKHRDRLGKTLLFDRERLAEHLSNSKQ